MSESGELGRVREAMGRGDWVAARRQLARVDQDALSASEREEASLMKLELGADPLAWGMLAVGTAALVVLGWMIL
ncbi:MAG: hypothetical protein AAGI01_15645 [Myxococcota bacterium]